MLLLPQLFSSQSNFCIQHDNPSYTMRTFSCSFLRRRDSSVCGPSALALESLAVFLSCKTFPSFSTEEYFAVATGFLLASVSAGGDVRTCARSSFIVSSENCSRDETLSLPFLFFGHAVSPCGVVPDRNSIHKRRCLTCDRDEGYEIVGAVFISLLSVQ